MSEERIGTEVNMDEYMTKAEYATEFPGVVDEATHANTAQGCNDALALGGKAPGYYAAKNDITELESRTNVALGGKVDTEDGKGLSTEDYTTAEKAKLAELGVEPVGCIKLFAGNVLPEGYLWCDGEAYPTNGFYEKLFAAIGTIYNKSDDVAGTFRVPDMRGRVGIGKNDKTFKPLGDTGGVEEHELNLEEMPQHSHKGAPHIHKSLNVGSNPSYKLSWKLGGYTPSNYASLICDQSPTDIIKTSDATFSGETGNAGIGKAHNNLQPYLVCNYIIKH